VPIAAGGGNVLNVQRTVKQLINVGAKGCFLEDQRWPKRVGHMRNKEVISMEEFAGKVRRLAGRVDEVAGFGRWRGCHMRSKEVISMEEFAGKVRRLAGKVRRLAGKVEEFCRKGGGVLHER
jgi:hypothetical protein